MSDDVEHIVSRRAKIVEQTRRDVWSCVLAVLEELERQPRSEYWAVNDLVRRLRLKGLERHWYEAGEHSGSKQLYQGTIVVFDDPEYPCSLAYRHARRIAPRQSVYWRGLGYFYASPLMFAEIGPNEQLAFGCDFGVSIYFGQVPKIREAFRRRLLLQEEVLRRLAGMSEPITSDAFRVYVAVAKDLGLRNIARSVTGASLGSAATNIGHSLHPIRVNQTLRDQETLADLYTSTRHFISADGQQPMQNEIWTLESRDVHGQEKLAVSFHEALAIINGRLRFLTPSTDCARAGGMEWLTT